MVPTTFGPHSFTAATAAAVVQCSRTILRVGNLACKFLRIGRNLNSAFKIVISFAWSDGHSPMTMLNQNLFQRFKKFRLTMEI